MTYIARWQKESIEQALKTRRVVIVAGARQSGKTTLAKKFVNSTVTYRTLDETKLLQAALADPETFIQCVEQCMIIDAIQKVPLLLPAIKKRVDEVSRAGQYLLTGSANIQSLPHVTESLAGRIRKIPLRSLAQGEIENHSPVFLPTIFSNFFSSLNILVYTRDTIIQIAICGGYPEVVSLPPHEQTMWYQDYVHALLERDLKDLTHIQRLHAMKTLIQVTAAWSTKPIDLSAIGSYLSITRPTIESYLNALEALYLIEFIPAWTKSDYDRINKKPKLIMNDSGFMTALLNWKFEMIKFDGDQLGKLIETHVGNELQKHIDAHGHMYTLWHYRDREKREIDFIIERSDGALVGIEVKASTTLFRSDFKHLQWFKQTFRQETRSFTGIVLYTGDQILSFGKNLWGIPIAAMY